MGNSVTRRGLMTQSALAVGAGLIGSSVQAAVPAGRDPYDYEITRTDEEWREMLSEEDYEILRGGGTETPFTHSYWQETAAGEYHCKGCDLHMYSSDHKYFPDKGWVFFTVCTPNSQLMAIDAASDMVDELVGDDHSESDLNDHASKFFIEAHCRRCGSHIGHILPVSGRALHCVNGGALVFKPEEA